MVADARCPSCGGVKRPNGTTQGEPWCRCAPAPLPDQPEPTPTIADLLATATELREGIKLELNGMLFDQINTEALMARSATSIEQLAARNRALKDALDGVLAIARAALAVEPKHDE